MKFGKLKSTKVSKGNKYPNGSGGIEDPKRVKARQEALKNKKEGKTNKTIEEPKDENLKGSGVTREITPAKPGTPPSKEYKGEKINYYETKDENTGDRSYGKDNPGSRRDRATDEELDKDIAKGDQYSMLHKNIRTGRDRASKIVKDSEGKIVSKNELDAIKKDVEEGEYQNPEKRNTEKKRYALGKVKHESVYEDKPGTEPTPEKKELKTTASEIYKVKKKSFTERARAESQGKLKEYNESNSGPTGTYAVKNKKSLGNVKTSENQFDRKGTTDTGEKYKASNLDIQPKWRQKLIKKS